MKRTTFNALEYYQFDSLQEDGVRHGVFTRLGGVSQGIYSSLNLSRSTGDTLPPVVENRRRMFEALDMHVDRSLTSWLVHGNTVRVVTQADIGEDDVHADAMITNARGLALTLRFADCVPVLFHDPVREVVGIAHAGWLGFVAGVLPAAIQAMRDAYGCNPRDIHACVGPSIGPNKFEVGEDVAAKIQSAVSDSVVITSQVSADTGPKTVPIRDDSWTSKPRVDLWRAAASQLYDAGVREIEQSCICTASNTHEWFSHRAEKGKTGRFGAVIELST
jgi:YfiH family protein